MKKHKAVAFFLWITTHLLTDASQSAWKVTPVKNMRFMLLSKQWSEKNACPLGREYSDPACEQNYSTTESG